MIGARGARRSIILLLGAGAFGLLLAAAATTSVQAAELTRVSGNGTVPGKHSLHSEMTRDGRFVTFHSRAVGIVPGIDNDFLDSYLYDRVTKGLEAVSVSAGGSEGNGDSYAGFVGGNGRFVAFGSRAGNLGPTGGVPYEDVFLKDRTTGSVSRITAGPASDGYSTAQGMSADGRFVAIFSYDATLVPGDTNDSPELFLHDVVLGTNERLALSTSGEQGDKGASQVTELTPDARYAVFSSHSTNLVGGDTNGTEDIFLRDRAQGTTERVSVSSDETQSTGGGSSGPSISPDARFVVFHSRATNLGPGDSNAATDVFLRDRQTGTTERVSLGTAGVQANGDSYEGDVSGDGRFVVFTSEADNLVPGDSNGLPDIFLRDRQAGTTSRVSLGLNGAQANGEGSANPHISDDGRFVSFGSGAPNLVPGDTNGAWDVFLLDRGPQGGVQFTDIEGSPYMAAIQALADAGIVTGYRAGDHWEFRPGANLWRAQFAKMIVGSWHLAVNEQTSFAPFTDLGADAPDSLYPHEFVGAAYREGITKGKTATTFAPYENIKRAQLISMVVRSLEKLAPQVLKEPPAGWSGLLPHSDPTHGQNIRKAEYNHLLDFIFLGGWNVWADARRGETAQVLFNMRKMAGG
jgi:TolB protein